MHLFVHVYKHICVHVYKHICAEYTRSCGRGRGKIHIHTYAYVSCIRVCMYESILGRVAEGGGNYTCTHIRVCLIYIPVCMYESILGLVAEGGEMCLSLLRPVH
jgi:hypothetical protein